MTHLVSMAHPTLAELLMRIALDAMRGIYKVQSIPYMVVWASCQGLQWVINLRWSGWTVYLLASFQLLW